MMQGISCKSNGKRSNPMHYLVPMCQRWNAGSDARRRSTVMRCLIHAHAGTRERVALLAVYIKLITLMLGLSLGGLSTPVYAANQTTPQAHVGFYIKKYGRADPANPLNRRTRQIFNLVQAVADKRMHRLPQLAIVNSAQNWAKALADGYIVLSAQAVKFSYHNVSQPLGDTRIAFLLGHELAHLANDDFFANPHKGVHAKEFDADAHGFIYAAMAGFPVNALLRQANSQQDFFTVWETHYQKHNANVQVNNDSHPSAHARAQALHTKLTQIAEQLRFFKFGVRLSHFDRCEDAIYFFKEFQKTFPSREVFNNLGYCALRQAQKSLGDRAYRYCMPTLLDIVSQADVLFTAPGSRTLRSPLDNMTENLIDTTPRLFLQQAINFFQQASEADPYYLSAYVNLAITYLYLDQIYHARAAIEKARELAPEDVDVLGLRDVIIYEEGQEADTWPQAIQSLQQLTQRPDVSACVRYNTAQLLAERGRSGAKALWAELVKESATLPLQVRQLLCQSQTCPQLTVKEPPRTWEPPVTLGQYIKRNPVVQSRLQAWNKQVFDWQTEIYGTLYHNAGAAVALLELIGYAEMLVLERPDVSVKALAEYCGQPLRTRTVAQGSVLSCNDWAAWVVEEQVREIWLVSRQ